MSEQSSKLNSNDLTKVMYKAVIGVVSTIVTVALIANWTEVRANSLTLVKVETIVERLEKSVDKDLVMLRDRVQSLEAKHK